MDYLSGNSKDANSSIIPGNVLATIMIISKYESIIKKGTGKYREFSAKFLLFVEKEANNIVSPIYQEAHSIKKIVLFVKAFWELPVFNALNS